MGVRENGFGPDNEVRGTILKIDKALDESFRNILAAVRSWRPSQGKDL